MTRGSGAGLLQILIHDEREWSRAVTNTYSWQEGLEQGCYKYLFMTRGSGAGLLQTLFFFLMKTVLSLIECWSAYMLKQTPIHDKREWSRAVTTTYSWQERLEQGCYKYLFMTRGSGAGLLQILMTRGSGVVLLQILIHDKREWSRAVTNTFFVSGWKQFSVW